jgi:hypothetical protein
MEHYYSEEEQQEMEAFALEAERKRQEEEDYNTYLQEQIDKEINISILRDVMISTDDFFPSVELTDFLLREDVNLFPPSDVF